MKKSVKLMTSVAAAVTTIAVSQQTAMATSSLLELIPSDWVSRTIQEVRNSIEQAQHSGVYVVQWGDTLSTISEATGISVAELSRLNNIEDVNLIIAGSTLYIDYVNHTVTYETPAAETVVTVSTETGEVVETPAELLVQTQEVEKTMILPAEELPRVSVEEQLVESVEVETASSMESLPDRLEPSLPEVSVVETEESVVTDVVTETPEIATETESVEVSDPTTQGTPITVEATAYSYQEAGLTNFTADGTDLTQDSRIIAVDPSVIPLGTMVYIPGYGTYRAADTGGAIVGNKIDIHFNTVEECYQFGRQQLTIYILN